MPDISLLLLRGLLQTSMNPAKLGIERDNLSMILAHLCWCAGNVKVEKMLSQETDSRDFLMGMDVQSIVKQLQLSN